MKNKWPIVYLSIVFLILYFPIFYLIFYAFNSGDSMQSFSGFSVQHFLDLFQDSRLLLIVAETFLLAFLSALISLIIGTFGAMGIYFMKRRRDKKNMLALNNILLVSPDVIIGASLLILFTFIGMKLGFVSVLLSHIAFSIPIVVLMVLPKLYEMNDSMIDAASDLGATPFQVLYKVVVPSLGNGIIAGFFMAFTYSLDDFAVTFFVTGNGFSTLSVEIYSRARQGIDLEINALSALVFLFSILLVLGYYFITKDNVKKEAVQLEEGVHH